MFLQVLTHPLLMFTGIILNLSIFDDTIYMFHRIIYVITGDSLQFFSTCLPEVYK